MLNIAALQFIAYATLTFTGVCIAGAALLFSYRQNYGWKPVVLVTSHGISGIRADGEDYIACLDFEFWNRRKYPVVIRIAEVDFGEIRLHEKISVSGEGLTWGIFHGKAIFRQDVRVDPASHYRFECRGVFPQRSLDDLDVMATISVYYFDPLKNKQTKKAIRHRYSFRIEE